jgi:hypothetical protein
MWFNLTFFYWNSTHTFMCCNCAIYIIVVIGSSGSGNLVRFDLYFYLGSTNTFVCVGTVQIYKVLIGDLILQLAHCIGGN